MPVKCFSDVCATVSKLVSHGMKIMKLPFPDSISGLLPHNYMPVPILLCALNPMVPGLVGLPTSTEFEVHAYHSLGSCVIWHHVDAI